MSYAGDVTPTDAYRALADDPDAVMVDVRTHAELVYVGHPDLSSIGKRLAIIEWHGSRGSDDGEFIEQLGSIGVAKASPIYFICRSGSRSRFAAMAATRAGYTTAYNVGHGFEGPMDSEGHRGTTVGWKADGLPWRQS